METHATTGGDGGVGLLTNQLDRAFPPVQTCRGPALRRVGLAATGLASLTLLFLVTGVVVLLAGWTTGHALLAIPAGGLAPPAALTFVRAHRLATTCDARHHSVLRSADAMLGALTEGLVIIKPDSTVAAANRSAAEILGMAPAEMVGRSLGSPLFWLVEDDGTPLREHHHPVRLALATGRATRGRVIGLQKQNQHLLWLSVSAAPLCEPGSAWDGCVVCTFTDVTDRRQDESALVARETELRRTLAGSPLVLWSVDERGSLVLVLGGDTLPVARQPELVGQPAAALFPEDPRFPQAVAQALEGANVSTLSHSGGLVFETRISPRRDAAGRVGGAHGVSIDVTLKERAEAEHRTLRDALRTAAAEWRATFDTIDSPVIVVSQDGRVRRVNRATQILWGDPFQKIVGAPLPRAERGAPWVAIARSVAACQSSGKTEAVGESDPSGKRHWDVVAVPLRGENDVPEGLVVVARDVSRVVSLRESLRHSERMAVMGQLVGGVAHQARNPLFGISATLDAFDAEFEDRPELKEYSDLLRHEARRLSRLMSDLLDYGKPARMTLRPHAVAVLIESVIRSCEPVARAAAVTLTTAVDDGLPSVSIDPERLEEAIRNVVENAIQHSPPGGEVRIWARADTSADHPGVRCGVEDSGPGFRAEDLPRLFEPFFTRRSGGTGLGLSLAQRIVEEHGGTITAANRPAGGALVTINVPLLARIGRADGDHDE